MTERGFCYWLMGYFELSKHADPNINFNKSQKECIIRHLNLVDEIEKSQLCAWIRGSIESSGSSASIFKKLSDHFEHVIDKQYPGDQNKLNSIHNNNTLYRC